MHLCHHIGPMSFWFCLFLVYLSVTWNAPPIVSSFILLWFSLLVARIFRALFTTQLPLIVTYILTNSGVQTTSVSLALNAPSSAGNRASTTTSSGSATVASINWGSRTHFLNIPLRPSPGSSSTNGSDLLSDAQSGNSQSTSTTLPDEECERLCSTMLLTQNATVVYVFLWQSPNSGRTRSHICCDF